MAKIYYYIMIILYCCMQLSLFAQQYDKKSACNSSFESESQAIRRTIVDWKNDAERALQNITVVDQKENVIEKYTEYDQLLITIDSLLSEDIELKARMRDDQRIHDIYSSLRNANVSVYLKKVYVEEFLWCSEAQACQSIPTALRFFLEKAEYPLSILATEIDMLSAQQRASYQYLKHKYQSMVEYMDRQARLCDGTEQVPAQQQYFAIKTASDWIQACKRLDFNRCAPIPEDAYSAADITRVSNNGFVKAGLSSDYNRWNEMLKVLLLFAEQKKKYLRTGGEWLRSQNRSYAFHDMMKQESLEGLSMKPVLQYAYIQKKVFESGAKVYMHGDYHGDNISLMNMLESFLQQGIIADDFKIQDPKTFFIFLGDYVDRGSFGVEVLYTVMRLATANPDRVYLIRGNHELADVNCRDGFSREVALKFPGSHFYSTSSKLSIVNQVYNYMPVALYAGCKNIEGGVDYIHCCHGGIDPSYNSTVKELLSNERVFYALLPECSLLNGFMWTDFHYDASAASEVSSRGEAIKKYGKLDTTHCLMQQSSPDKHIIVRGVMRGHQHSCNADNLLMRALIASKGVYKMWHPVETATGEVEHRVMDDGIVWTANVAPDSIYGACVGFDFDTHAKIVMDADYKKWKMYVFTLLNDQLCV